jgi:hypothetical protein
MYFPLVPDCVILADECVVISRKRNLLKDISYIHSRVMRRNRLLELIFVAACSTLLLLLTACGATAEQVVPQQTVTVNSGFQSQVSPLPKIPAYLCGAWSSNNAPHPNSSILVFARITQNLAGVHGATATAVVHFQSGDQELDQHPTSDNGGYVSFKLDLQGRQPTGTPATVDVTFGFPGVTVKCTSAFFTPM